MSFQEIIAELPKLSDEERLQLALRLAELGVPAKALWPIIAHLSSEDFEILCDIREGYWDAEIQHDHQKGKLDGRIQDALRAYREGRVAKLP